MDEQQVLDHTLVEGPAANLGAAFLAPPSHAVPVPIEEGQPINIVVEHTIRRLVDAESLSFTFGVQLDGSEPERLIAESVSAAATVDLAVVVVGTTSSLESEGFDRTSLALPGLQDELVHRVAEANPKTVVVVNAGAPVTMPWHDNVAAILLSWFGGQEFSHALTDVLTGTTEPRGRLPTTWPASIDDVPVLDCIPANDVLRYTEGINIGYRAWLKTAAEPAYPFGYRLGYTSWSLERLTATTDTVAEGSSVIVTLDVTNTGTRTGKQVIQLYRNRRHDATPHHHRDPSLGLTPISAQRRQSAHRSPERPPCKIPAFAIRSRRSPHNPNRSRAARPPCRPNPTMARTPTAAPDGWLGDGH